MSVSISGAGSISGLDQGFNVTTGSVGIGTDNPAYSLDFGKTSSTIRLVSENNGTAIRIGAGAGNADVSLIRVDGSAVNDVYGETNDSSYGFSLKYMGSRSGNSNSFSIFADNQTGTQFEALTILQDGKIGINQTSPNAPLSFNTGVGQKIELYNSGSGNEFGIGVENSEFRISSGTGSVITFRTGGYSGPERVRIDADGTLLVNSAIDNTSSHGVIVAHAPASNADTGYKSIEIGNSNGSGSNRGSTICGQPKSDSHPPYTLIGCWDTGTNADVYYGGGWGSNMRPATQHRIYTNSTYPTANGSGTERIRITSGGQVNIGGDLTQTGFTASITRTSSETDILRIKGNGGNAFVRFEDNDASSSFTLGADDAVGSGGFALYDRSDSAYRVVVDTNGRVSINATSPAQVGGQTPYLYVSSYTNLDGLRIRGLDTGNTIWKTGGDMSLTVASNNAINLKTQSATRFSVTGNGQVTMPNQPCFWATSNTGGSDTSEGYTGIFSNQLEAAYVNVGNHYNTSTGVFTCPVAGTYEFHGQGLIRYQTGVGRAELSFYKNGANTMSRAYGYTYITGVNDHDNLHVMAYITCAANDQIDLRVYAMDSGIDCYFAQGLGYFAGRLVQ